MDLDTAVPAMRRGARVVSGLEPGAMPLSLGRLRWFMSRTVVLAPVFGDVPMFGFGDPVAFGFVDARAF